MDIDKRTVFYMVLSFLLAAVITTVALSLLTRRAPDLGALGVERGRWRQAAPGAVEGIASRPVQGSGGGDVA
jgi:hypothetical protein